MTLHKKSIVASGHTLVSDSAGAILAAGGNAFDAVVAAGFASTLVEQTLTSLGGGGFLLGHSEEYNQDLFFDFFVDTPGCGRLQSEVEPHFFPVTVQFSGAPQDFNVGLGSVAVPGTVKGLLHVHQKLGRMPLQDVVQPAIELARGHRLNCRQAYFLSLLRPITTMFPEGKELYGDGDSALVEGDILRNHKAAVFLEQLIDDLGDSFYRGDIAKAIDEDMRNGNGLLTLEDLSSYKVIERAPLKLPYRDAKFLTAPAPSIGGLLIGLSLALQGAHKVPECSWDSTEHLMNTLGLMQEVEILREQGITTVGQFEEFLENDGLFSASVNQYRLFSRGTTHVSIADSEGNCASMTCSNGEGSGYFAPGTGIMLNNMMGEDDLHPDGFHSSPPGQRVASMMSPSMLVKDGRVELVIGSGGSKRIRTAISQVLVQVTDFNRPLQKAVDAPRLYWDGSCLQVEPGFSVEAMNALKERVDVNIWDEIDVFFGGVHAVVPGCEGAGDLRRGGAVVEIKAEK
jgi:gamma-glutamyltranspeptidase / glutathione hydrolase